MATEPLTVFDPNPILNQGIIDIGRSILSTLFHANFEGAEQLKEGCFGNGAEYNSSALQASIILNAYWKFVYQHKTGRIAEINTVRELLAQTSHLL